MRKYAWLLALALLGALALLSACSGEAAPTTPRSTITPTSIPPTVTTTTTTATQTGGIPLIPHSIAGRENCLVCHETGIAGSVAIPADHAGRTNDTCTACHQVAGGTGTPTSTGTATQPSSIPQIPHDITGRTDCKACHDTGIGGAIVLPADHAGRGNDICTACHQTASPPTVVIAQIPHSTTGLTDCLLCHQTGVGSAMAVPADHAGITNGECTGCHFQASNPTAINFPQIPHTIAGREACLACHQTGAGGATVVLADHAGRTNATCTICHAESPNATSVAIPQIPHYTAGFESCSTCHATGIGGAPAYPSDHAGRADSTCTACHQPAASQVTLHYPSIDHGLAGRDQCLLCHETGIAGAPVVPATHAGRTNDTCQVCHKIGDDD
jgi:hypothetical protein